MYACTALQRKRTNLYVLRSTGNANDVISHRRLSGPRAPQYFGQVYAYDCYYHYYYSSFLLRHSVNISKVEYINVKIIRWKHTVKLASITLLDRQMRPGRAARDEISHCVMLGYRNSSRGTGGKLVGGASWCLR